MVLSCASPCIQGITDPVNASTMATFVNDELARQISNNTFRFGAFASLAMHDPAVAAKELRRTVKELSFLGALINDYQQAGNADNRKYQLTFRVAKTDSFSRRDLPVLRSTPVRRLLANCGGS